MTAEEIVSCWKDEACRGRYAADVRARLPDNPAGPSPLDRAELDASGGTLPSTVRVGSAWLSCTQASMVDDP